MGKSRGTCEGSLEMMNQQKTDSHQDQTKPPVEKEMGDGKPSRRFAKEEKLAGNVTVN